MGKVRLGVRVDPNLGLLLGRRFLPPLATLLGRAVARRLGRSSQELGGGKQRTVRGTCTPGLLRLAPMLAARGGPFLRGVVRERGTHL